LENNFSSVVLSEKTVKCSYLQTLSLHPLLPPIAEHTLQQGCDLRDVASGDSTRKPLIKHHERAEYLRLFAVRSRKEWTGREREDVVQQLHSVFDWNCIRDDATASVQLSHLVSDPTVVGV
jgi:hypothetical protein